MKHLIMEIVLDLNHQSVKIKQLYLGSSTDFEKLT